MLICNILLVASYWKVLSPVLDIRSKKLNYKWILYEELEGVCDRTSDYILEYRNSGIQFDHLQIEIQCLLVTIKMSGMKQVVRALDGNISLDDLNEGNTPGHSRAFSSFESSGYDTGQYNEDLKKFRKLALEQETSEYSGPSSDYGQHQSASSSSGLQNAPEK